MFVRFVKLPEHAAVRAFYVRCRHVLYVNLASAGNLIVLI